VDLFTIKKNVQMLYKLLFLSCISLLTNNTVYSQIKTHFFDNTREIEINRYEDVKGTPYIYKEWRLANIIDSKDLIFEDVKINYNGYTENFEVRIDNKFIELDEKFYKRIDVLIPNNEKEVYLPGVHEKLNKKFIRVLFKKDKIMLLKDFKARMIENVVQNVGKPETFKRFVPIKKYFILNTDELTPINLTKKSILAYFDNKIDLDDFVKKNKIKMKSEEDIIKILEYWIETSDY
jgi:hypothetical protein